MALSNTAVPKYYGMFRDAVIRGEIPVCEEISMQMNRIDERISNPLYYYDDDAIDGWVTFCESELTLDTGANLELTFVFKLWAEDLYSWFYYVDQSVYVPSRDGHSGHYVNKRILKRLTNKQYLIVGRSAAKSLYLSCIHAYGLVVDTSTTHQITTSPTMKQSEEVTQPIATAITRSKGPLFQFLTQGSLQNTTGSRANRQQLASTKLGIQSFITNSYLEIRPLKINKLQGLRVKYATLDEWLSGDIPEDPIEAIAQGGAKGPIPDYIIVAASSEGTTRNGVGDEIKMELSNILRGEYQNPHVSIWWYKLDSMNELNNPDMWVKANPNLGITVSYETYQIDYETAINVPSKRNDILAKRFGIPMEGHTYFFTYQDTLCHKKREFWNMPCSLGADLSLGDDFCSFTFLFPLKNGSFGIKTRNYITETTMAKLPQALHEKYESFIAEGSLIVMPGVVFDSMIPIYEDLMQFIDDANYDVLTFGYDPYNAKEFVERWITEHGDYGVTKVIQGFRTESVPLGELRKLAEERMLLFDEEIMKFSMGNCIALEDTNGNRKLYKRRHEQKIDAVAAMMDGYVAYKLYAEAFE